jgi:hypothetical protein
VHACVSVLRNVGKVQKLCFVASFVVGEAQVDLEHRRGAAAITRNVPLDVSMLVSIDRAPTFRACD